MAVAMFNYFRSLLAAVDRDERAQDIFEYLLVIGGVSILVIVAVATPVGTDMAGAVVDGVCDAVAAVIPAVTCPA